MAIVVNLDVMMAKRKMSLNELSEKVDITLANLSILKTKHNESYRSKITHKSYYRTYCEPNISILNSNNSVN